MAPRRTAWRGTIPSKPSSRFEREARSAGYVAVAGVDEVGRGCLFGPVVAGAVILDPERPIRGLADSKVLDADQREELARRIRERSVAWAVAGVDAGWIDRINIYQAARRAMQAAVAKLSLRADYLLIDAMRLDLPIAQQSLIKGDARCRSIAAASIVAKVERDAWLARWDAVYPGYGLASNKGYATPDHLRALTALGPTPAHRMSFEPVAAVARFCRLAPQPLAAEQLALFQAAGAQ
ncbi:MAG: ribonuclease HII [Acidobacteria bacterium]|nr:ribonuclease HII [Acidobacteriota bacterium]